MMKSTTLLYARTSALPAIAAAVALSSTPLLAQEVPPAQPTTTEPATNTPPTSTSTPTTDEPTTTAADSITAAPATTDAAATAPSRTTRTAHRTTYGGSAKAAPAPAASHTVTSRIVHAAPLAAAAPVAPANRTSHVDPVVDLSAQPPAPRLAAVKRAKKKDATLPIAGGALAFLAIGGVAVAMTRRRDEEEEVAEKVEHEPVAAAPEPVIHEEQPSIVGPSAFAWGESQRPRAASSDQDDRRPGETWVERAYRGPTADNPSASLRTRLKRAAFFDKRERDVAAGVAEPIDLDAGLPDAMIEEQERGLA
jgi:hypothetical protein